MAMRSVVVRVGVAVATLLGLTGAFACSSNAVGIDSCRKIEDARCENAMSCSIDLTKPVHRGDTPSLDVGACKRFYADACLHGLASGNDPGAVQVQACVDAINNTADCAIVKNPEKTSACAFLVPPSQVAVLDASTD